MRQKPEPKLAKCGRCKTLYVRTHSHVCSRCLDAEDSDFLRIRDVLVEHPTLNLAPEELADAANVTIACILRMLDQDMLAAEGDEEILCGKCGAPAISVVQRLCTACMFDLDRQLSMELSVARLNRPDPLNGVAHHVHQMLDAKRRKP